MEKVQCFLVVCAICGLSIQLLSMLLPPSPHKFTFQSPMLQGNHSQEKNNSAVLREAEEILTQNSNDTVDDTTLVVLPRKLTYMTGSVVQDPKPSDKKKLMVIFNRPEWLFEDDPHYQKVFDTCSHTCTITDDRKMLPVADAMWVDLGRLKDPQPPAKRPPGQVWVAHSSESPIHYSGHHDSPAWKNVFNWTFSYRTDSDFFRPYGTFEVREKPAAENYTRVTLNKTRPIAWFVSNCQSPSKREQYVAQLNKSISVDIYGGCGTFPCPRGPNEKCMSLLNTTYFFYLAFENSYCQDYVTEKLFKTYNNLNVIPIVRGALNYSQYLPPNTYLDTANFSSPQHLAHYLHQLMRDVHTYTAMLRTKDRFFSPVSSWIGSSSEPFCQLCKQLHTPRSLQKTYPDIMEWSSKDKCWPPPDA